jgi:hypothetical protein
VGDRVCDCRVAALLAMTKRGKLLVMANTKIKNEGLIVEV